MASWTIKPKPYLRGRFAPEGERHRGGGGKAAYWLPIIALHSGARLSELAQLNVKDIVVQGGVKCFRVIDGPEEGQSIKNAVSHRLVPIHKRIIELASPITSIRLIVQDDCSPICGRIPTVLRADCSANGAADSRLSQYGASDLLNSLEIAPSTFSAPGDFSMVCNDL